MKVEIELTDEQYNFIDYILFLKHQENVNKMYFLTHPDKDDRRKTSKDPLDYLAALRCSITANKCAEISNRLDVAKNPAKYNDVSAILTNYDKESEQTKFVEKECYELERKHREGTLDMMAIKRSQKKINKHYIKLFGEETQ